MRKSRYYIPAVVTLGRHNVEAFLERRGYENPKRTMNSWIARRKVSSGSMDQLMQLAEESGESLRASDFLVRDLKAEQ